MHFVYFLLLNNGAIYKGSSERLSERIEEHKAGKVASSRHKRPHVVLGYEGYTLKSDAIRRERFLKTSEGRHLLQQQYRDSIEQQKKRSGVV